MDTLQAHSVVENFRKNILEFYFEVMFKSAYLVAS